MNLSHQWKNSWSLMHMMSKGCIPIGDLSCLLDQIRLVTCCISGVTGAFHLTANAMETSHERYLVMMERGLVMSSISPWHRHLWTWSVLFTCCKLETSPYSLSQETANLLVSVLHCHIVLLKHINIGGSPCLWHWFLWSSMNGPEEDSNSLTAKQSLFIYLIE